MQTVATRRYGLTVGLIGLLIGALWVLWVPVDGSTGEFLG